MFKAALVLSQQYNVKIDGEFIGWQAAQTGGNAIGALRSTCQAVITANVIGIVGPVYSREASIIAAFAHSDNIPAISYAATEPDLSDRNAYPNFYRTVTSDAAVTLPIVKLFTRYNWTSCIIIYQNDEFGSGGTEVISNAFSENNLIISKFIVFDIATQHIRGDLKDILSTTPTRIIIVWADDYHTSLILQIALNFDVLGPYFTWILSSKVSFNFFNQTMYTKLIGMLILEPIIGSVVNAPFNTTLLNAAYQIWQQYEPETFPGSTKVNYYALFAFDATWALIQSLQQFCSTYTNSSSPCISIVNNSFCFDRHLLNATSFLNTISTTEFVGVSGPVKFSANVTDRIDGIYYVIRDIQPSTNNIELVPVLQWSNSDNWKTYTQADVIIWPGNTLIPPTGFAGLKGINLRICIIESMPFIIRTDIIEQNQTKLSGYVPDLINLLQTRMGFIPYIIYPPANQTYDGLIKAVATSVCDVAIGDITVTAKRREIVDFSTSIFDNSLRIIVRQTKTVHIDLLSYLRPFSLNLCGMSMWYSIGTIMGYGADFHVQTAAERLLTIGLYLLSLVLVATYTANLASDLTISKSKDSISGIDDIKNGKISFSRIGILIEASVEDYYLREVSEGVRNYYPLKTQNELFNSLLNNLVDASILDTSAIEYYTNNIYCNLTFVEKDFAPSSYGIAYPKQWLYGEDLDVIILSLRESGVLDDLKEKWFDKNVCQHSSSSYVSTSIKLEEMSGLFVTFGLISILSLVLFTSKKIICYIRLSKKINITSETLVVQTSICHLTVEHRLINEREISILAHQFPNVKYLKLLFIFEKSLYIRCFQTLFSVDNNINGNRCFWAQLIKFSTDFYNELNIIMDDNDVKHWLIQNTDMKFYKSEFYADCFNSTFRIWF
ncbi:unnamed protein product [Rotaria sordida]|uniref:Ionotropic glutamate receptor C-terminal domain-containing protein n=2 Tax=Rotaria sordida TaxID=392033 RepID=A0A816A5I9_9BILA|nr:unnamed protein product [Rotaria sordida]CAF1591783.1 unnamed protein product [Rotaria sordida]